MLFKAIKRMQRSAINRVDDQFARSDETAMGAKSCSGRQTNERDR